LRGSGLEPRRPARFDRNAKQSSDAIVSKSKGQALTDRVASPAIELRKSASETEVVLSLSSDEGGGEGGERSLVLLAFPVGKGGQKNSSSKEITLCFHWNTDNLEFCA